MTDQPDIDGLSLLRHLRATVERVLRADEEYDRTGDEDVFEERERAENLLLQTMAAWEAGDYDAMLRACEEEVLARVSALQPVVPTPPQNLGATTWVMLDVIGRDQPEDDTAEVTAGVLVRLSNVELIEPYPNDARDTILITSTRMLRARVQMKQLLDALRQGGTRDLRADYVTPERSQGEIANMLMQSLRDGSIR